MNFIKYMVLILSAVIFSGNIFSSENINLDIVINEPIHNENPKNNQIVEDLEKTFSKIDLGLIKSIKTTLLMETDQAIKALNQQIAELPDNNIEAIKGRTLSNDAHCKIIFLITRKLITTIFFKRLLHNKLFDLHAKVDGKLFISSLFHKNSDPEFQKVISMILEKFNEFDSSIGNRDNEITYPSVIEDYITFLLSTPSNDSQSYYTTFENLLKMARDKDQILAQLKRLKKEWLHAITKGDSDKQKRIIPMREAIIKFLSEGNDIPNTANCICSDIKELDTALDKINANLQNHQNVINSYGLQEFFERFSAWALVDVKALSYYVPFTVLNRKDFKRALTAWFNKNKNQNDNSMKNALLLLEKLGYIDHVLELLKDGKLPKATAELIEKPLSKNDQEIISTSKKTVTKKRTLKNNKSGGIDYLRWGAGIIGSGAILFMFWEIYHKYYRVR